MSETYPRTLSAQELDLMRWVLPDDREGYAAVRRSLERWSVLSVGRRGEGSLLLGPAGGRADLASPLSPVLAFGLINLEAGSVAVTVRDPEEDQAEIEIVPQGSGREVGRWTYSTWLPERPCPQCGRPAREVRMTTAAGQTIVLALCATDRRVWVYESLTGVSRPVPVTNFYTELMAVTGVRDPAVALKFGRLFDGLSGYRDDDLIRAFVSYNGIRAKVRTDDPVREPARRRSLFERAAFFLRRTA